MSQKGTITSTERARAPFIDDAEDRAPSEATTSIELAACSFIGEHEDSDQNEAVASDEGKEIPSQLMLLKIGHKHKS